MDKPFISICIPCYNMEKYVGDCLDSIIGQSFKNWEVICTDDGSRDSTGCILDEYANKDCRIQVVHSENCGLSTARNKASARATGEWIWFVDSDDILLKGALAWFKQFTEKNDCDGYFFSRFVSFRDKCVSDVVGGGEIIKRTMPGDGKLLFFQKTELPELPFQRIVKRTLFEHAQWPDGINWLEDSIQLYRLLCLKARYAFVDVGLYGYRHRGNSLSHGWTRGKFPLVLKSLAVIFHTAQDGLAFSPGEMEALYKRKGGQIEYYMYQAFNNENKDGICKAAAEYAVFQNEFGRSFVNRFLRLRMKAVKWGVYGATAKAISFAEYIYRGVAARFRRFGGCKKI